MLNNKGFAISIVLYSICAIIIVVLLLIISVNATGVHNKSNMSEEIKKQISHIEVLRLDKEVPTIVAKQDNTYIRWDIKPNTTPADYFSVTTGVSGGTVSCTVNNVNELPLGVNTVTCTVTGGNGLSSSASTVFRHQYTGTPYCESGGTLTNNNTACYYGSNSSVCGSSCTSYAQVYNPCKTTTNTCQAGQSSECEVYQCTLYKTCQICKCSVGLADAACTDKAGWIQNCRTILDQTGVPSFETKQSSLCGSETVTGSRCNNANSRRCIQYKTDPCVTGSPNECVPGYDTGSCNGWVANSCSKSDFTYLKYSCPDGGTYNTSNKLCQF